VIKRVKTNKNLRLFNYHSYYFYIIPANLIILMKWCQKL